MQRIRLQTGLWEKNMNIKIASAIWVVLVVTAGMFAQVPEESPASPADSNLRSVVASPQTDAPHVAPSRCGYRNASCIWGQVFDRTGHHRGGARPQALRKGPIDVCQGFDYNCSVPVLSICRLHGQGSRDSNPDHPGNGSYWLVLPTSSSWVVKPRVAGTHLGWYPRRHRVRAGIPGGTYRWVNFHLTSGTPDTSICSN